MDAPLAGLVVIAVEQAVAAPFCTSRLAEARVRVIKIERPDGDFARFYDDSAPGSSSDFAWLDSLQTRKPRRSGRAGPPGG